jgi:hypothetical protein
MHKYARGPNIQGHGFKKMGSNETWLG